MSEPASEPQAGVWLTVLLLSLMLDGGLFSELYFVEEPSDVIAVRDRALMLNCQVEGVEPITITWRKDGLPLQGRGRISVLHNGSLCICNFLKKKENNESDVGEYDCTARNRFGILLSRKARVQVATLPRFQTHPQSMKVQLGGVARFECHIFGIPEAKITWELNRVPLNMEDARYTLLPTGVLQITRVQQQDLGSYRCVAVNIANTRASQEATLSLSVSSPQVDQEPVILSGPQNLTLTIHQTAILECIATGNPKPIVSWSRLDGRSIGVDGIEVLGTGNLMISDVTVHHSGIYVCAANKPGTRVRRTAQGRLVVQAPPEFVQWPQSVSKPAGSTAVFTCVAQGVPEPHVIWLKNGNELTSPSENIKLTHSNSTLIINHITPSDEAIYQCIAKNSAGTNQASARLAVALSQELPEPPDDVWAEAVSRNAIRLSWKEPAHSVTEEIIGYVLHIRRAADAEGKELQEAVSKTAFQHVFTNLEPATTYSMYIKSYSPVGASSPSHLVTATTAGQEPSALYEIKMSAFNQHGDGNSTERYVSLRENTELPAPQTPPCDCKASTESPLTGIVVGIHIGMACIIFCVLILMLGYQRSLFGCKGIKESWTVPQAGHSLSQEGQNGHVELDKKDEAGRVMEMTEFVSGKFQNGDAVSENGHDRECSSSQLQVVIEQHPTGPKP
ncbi:immunoglobulin superfamily DCC subclass member 3-like isoform X3 [Chiloscyllium punctatum]|uniref:immunoglobulin superfamily DCC subclass member 3-like isoform X3 n=1 Tax=Chiloscyllium punctatum TaxID=137246 RepID=UPI003B63E445